MDMVVGAVDVGGSAAQARMHAVSWIDRAKQVLARRIIGRLDKEIIPPSPLERMKTVRCRQR
jgi:hypothetical protein